MGRVRSSKRRVRDDDFIVGYRRMWSDYRRIVFLLAEAFREFPLKSWASRFRGRRSVWWGWTVTLDHWWLAFCVAGAVFGEVAGCLCLLRALEMRLHMWRRSLMTCILLSRRSIWWGCRVPVLAPRIGNDVSYVSQTGDIDFVWHAQHLVRLEGDFTCSAHWKWCFICEADPWWLRYSVAGAVFGEVAGWLHFLRLLEMKFHMSRRSLMTFILRGRRSIWWGWRVTLLAPRIVNDVSK